MYPVNLLLLYSGMASLPNIYIALNLYFSNVLYHTSIYVTQGIVLQLLKIKIHFLLELTWVCNKVNVNLLTKEWLSLVYNVSSLTVNG